LAAGLRPNRHAGNRGLARSLNGQGGAARPSSRKQQRLNSYLQGLLINGLTVLPYDGKAALWHGEQRARLEAKGLRQFFETGSTAGIQAPLARKLRLQLAALHSATQIEDMD
jgi:hypothetical protein